MQVQMQDAERCRQMQMVSRPAQNATTTWMNYPDEDKTTVSSPSPVKPKIADIKQ